MDSSQQIMLIAPQGSKEASLAENLEKRRYTVTLLHSLANAQAAFDGDLPQILILDTGLLGEDAFSFYLRLQKDQRFRSIPVIFFVKSGEEERIALNMGAEFAYQKPIDKRSALMAVNRMVKLREKLAGQVSGPQKSLEGRLSDFKAAEVLQFVGITDKSGTIKAHHDDTCAMVSFKNGRVHDCLYMRSTEEMHRGLDGVKKFLDMKEGHFFYDDTVMKTEKPLDLPVQMLLMRWLADKDEGYEEQPDQDQTQEGIRPIISF